MRILCILDSGLPKFWEIRMEICTHALQIALQKYWFHSFHPAEEAEFYCLVSFEKSLEEMQKRLLEIREKTLQAPLFLISPFSLDYAAMEKVPLECCDGFIPLSSLEFTLQEISNLSQTADLPGIVALIINRRGRPDFVSPITEKRIFPTQYYFSVSPNFDSQGYRAVIPALGCSWRCHHCAITSREGFFRQPLIEDFQNLILHWVQNQKILKLDFLNQAMNASPGYLARFCAFVIENHLQFSYKLGLLFEKMEDDFLHLLKKSGCKEVRFHLFGANDLACFEGNIAQRLSVVKSTLKQFKHFEIPVRLIVHTGLVHEGFSEFFELFHFLEDHCEEIEEVLEVRTISVEPGSFFARRQDQTRLSLNPVESQSWVIPFSEGLNDFRLREQKKQWLISRLKPLKIYLGKSSCSGDLSFLDQKYDEWRQKQVDIVLVNCPPWGYLNPPVGLAKISSYARNRGFKTKILDYNVGFYRRYEEMQRLWHVENKSYWSNDITFDVIAHIYHRDIEEAVNEILSCGCKLIGFSCVDPKERMTVEFIRRLRERDSSLKIIIGGPVCSTKEYRQIFVDKLGSSGVDLFVIGEGEDTLIEILDRNRQDFPLRGVAGCAWVDENLHWVESESRQKVDLTKAPLTTYEEFDLEEYSCRELIVEWSRGCIGTCAFCKAKILDGKFRSYTPEHIIESLSYYVKNYKIYDYTICDLAFNGNWKLLEKIADALIASGLQVRLRAQGIPRRQMKLELLKKLHQAGFIEIQWGVESGSDEVLKLMDKSWMFTAQEAQEVIRNSYLSGIKTCMFCIIGYPGETEEEFIKTYDFVDRNAEYIDMVKSVNSLHIITDTPVHHRAEEFGLTLPKENYHYLWSMPGNTHEIRQERVKRMLELIRIKKIECLETNYLEGRQFVLIEDYKKKYIPMEERVHLLQRDINTLIDYRMNEQENWAQASDPRGEFLEKNRDLIGVFHGKKAIRGPEVVEIDLSNNCNFNCVGCWCHCDDLEELKTPAQKRKHHLGLETIQALVKDLAHSGTKTIQIAGPGEPFTHPQIMEIIRYIKGNGLELHIITNFSYITHEIAQELMDLKVDQITCSLWAGSEDAFVKTHPNQTKGRFQKIQEVLSFIGNNKKYNHYPRIKIFNVISHLNASDLDNMVNFGLEVRADTMEFTVVDTVPGKTDFLALTLEDLEQIEASFERITKRATYPDPPGRKHLEGLDSLHLEEHYEVNARFFTDLGDYQGFVYEPVNKVMTCQAGFANETMTHDPFFVCANIFHFNEEQCRQCKLFSSCQIDKRLLSIKTRFFAVLGFGSFMRRAKMSVIERFGDKKEEVVSDLLPRTPFVDTLPCTIGWTYARITTAGEVIPCCKGYNKPLGNLYKNHFPHIWSDHSYQEFRYKAKNLQKSDLYFEEIGCYKACDNIGNNMEILKRINRLKPREKEWLEEAARELER